MRIRRSRDTDPDTGDQDLGSIGCEFRRRAPRHDPRLEQDMDAMLEADVEYFDHPTMGRVRLRDVLVWPDEDDPIEDDPIEAEQEQTEHLP